MTPGLWLFGTSTVYALVGLFNVFVYRFTEIEYIQPFWLLITASPLFISSLGRWVGVHTVWEIFSSKHRSSK